MDPDLLAKDFERNTRVIQAQAAGLSHQDSLLQTPYRINCFNWTLGHVLDGRGRALEMLGSPRLIPAEETVRYRRESEPILEDGPGVLPFDRLVAGVEETGAAICARLGSLDAAALAEESDAGDGNMVALGERVHFQYFHDTYHTGQTELLRQVTGVGDKII